jgi:hypothetical protein
MKSLSLAAALAVALLLAAAARGETREIARAGPLSLEATLSTGREFNLNYGVVKQSRLGVKVTHNGRAVRAGSGTEARDLVFWEAWVLPGAPRPAVLGLDRGAWLVTIEGGEPRVQMLRGAYSDNASWQWLDGPQAFAAPYKAYIRDKLPTVGELRGGRFLLVSQVALLDIQSLSVRPLDITGGQAGNMDYLRQADGYGWASDGVLMMSPDGSAVAGLGRNTAGTIAVGSTANPDYAMVVIDLASQSRKAVPFDRNALRLADAPADATPAWAASRFEWAKGAGGRPQLVARRHAKPPPWLGKLTQPQVDDNVRDTRFTLMPTDLRMVDPLVAWLGREFGARPNPATDRLALDIRGLAVRVTVRQPDPQDEYGDRRSYLYLSRDWSAAYNPERHLAANRLVAEIGERLNAHLAAGGLQEFFTRMPEER